jgi:hypothetical protein
MLIVRFPRRVRARLLIRRLSTRLMVLVAEGWYCFPAELDDVSRFGCVVLRLSVAVHCSECLLSFRVCYMPLHLFFSVSGVRGSAGSLSYIVWFSIAYSCLPVTVSHVADPFASRLSLQRTLESENIHHATSHNNVRNP